MPVNLPFTGRLAEVDASHFCPATRRSLHPPDIGTPEPPTRNEDIHSVPCRPPALIPEIPERKGVARRALIPPPLLLASGTSQSRPAVAEGRRPPLGSSVRAVFVVGPGAPNP